MNYASLVFGVREGCGDSFLYSSQTISAEDYYIFDATVFALIKDAEPVLGTFHLLLYSD